MERRREAGGGGGGRAGARREQGRARRGEARVHESVAHDNQAPGRRAAGGGRGGRRAETPRPPVYGSHPFARELIPFGGGGLGATLQQFAWPEALHSFIFALQWTMVTMFRTNVTIYHHLISQAGWNRCNLSIYLSQIDLPCILFHLVGSARRCPGST